ncbi:hypothetical protein F67_I3_11_017 [Rhizobium phage RHph_I3_11]|nr:hypothetical protein F67_I3_11_017 [Rhizobium phage RHph_I3_11]
MTYDWAKPGVKVVCVKEIVRLDGYKEERLPVVGEVYTIREVLPSIYPSSPFAVRLEEIRNPIMMYSNGVSEVKFGSEKFRPLVSKPLPESLTCLLKNPKSVILPNEGNRWDVRKQKEKIR